MTTSQPDELRSLGEERASETPRRPWTTPRVFCSDASSAKVKSNLTYPDSHSGTHSYS